jgi:hypothetical protein
MRTPETKTVGAGAIAREVTRHAASIARLELRLAIAELKEKSVSIALAVGLGMGAVILGLVGLAFAAATVAAAIGTVLPTWLADLIVSSGFIALAGLLAVIAVRSLKHATPPVPRQAIEEAKLTARAVRGNGSRENS